MMGADKLSALPSLTRTTLRIHPSYLPCIRLKPFKLLAFAFYCNDIALIFFKKMVTLS